MGIILFIASIIIIAKAAEMEGYSSLLWGINTFCICILSIALIPIPIFNTIIGLVISFFALFITKIIRQREK